MKFHKNIGTLGTVGEILDGVLSGVGGNLVGKREEPKPELNGYFLA